MKTLRERKRERTHQRATAAALELFLANGYEQTTMRDIAERAEVSRATLFNYFPSKGDLLLVIAQDLMSSQIEPQIRAVLGAQLGVLDTFRGLFAAVAELMAAYPDLMRAMVGHFSQGTGVFGVTQGDQDTGLSAAMRVIVEQGQRRGEVRSDLDAQQIANYVNVLHTAAFIESGQEPAQYRVKCEALLAFLQGGFLPGSPS